MTRRDPWLKAGDLFQNQFEILGLLGSGGHAFVYRAHDQIMGRQVALKLIEIPAGSASDRRRRARLEAQVLGKLTHENIVRVFGAGATDDGWIYLVMEVLEGRSLREAIAEYQRLRLSEALFIGAQIADGVHAAHQASTVHRDLKPENVFIEHDNKVRVIDFGVAKFEAPEAQTTQRDLIHGTLYYMSPEHLQGFRVTPRSDVFALGVTLYEMLAGIRPALVGLQEVNPNAVVYHQIQRMPPALHELHEGVPEFVSRTIQRMLAKNPVDRWQGMDEVASVLRANLARLHAEAGPEALQTRDLSRPFARQTSDTSERPAHDTDDEPGLGAATTRPLRSSATAPTAALPTPQTAGAEVGADALSPTSPGYATRIAPSSPPPSWSSGSAPPRGSARRALRTVVALAGVLGLGVGLASWARSQQGTGGDSTSETTAPAASVILGTAPSSTALSQAFEFAAASPGASGSAFTGASARAENQASAGRASRTGANGEQASLPGSGLGEPRAARTRAAAHPRPRATAPHLPQFGPEDIR